MPELKNTFTGGRMEKDLDERIVPNGQYREALNIGVATSEDSDVGAAQNILGNIQVTKAIQGSNNKYAGTNSHIAQVVDPQTDMLYRFINTEPTPEKQHGIWMDRIVEYDTTKNLDDPWDTKEASVMVDVYKVKSTLQWVQPICPVLPSGVSGDRWEIKLVGNEHINQLRWGMFIKMGIPEVDSADIWIEDINYLTGVIRVVDESNSGLTYLEMNVSYSGMDITFHGDRNLNFHPDRKITGINIIDGMIFWTDNYSEPKKVNIERGKQGSQPLNWLNKRNMSASSPYHPFEIHTLLVVEDDVPMDCTKDEKTCAQYGCMDPSAANYDPNATEDCGAACCEQLAYECLAEHTTCSGLGGVVYNWSDPMGWGNVQPSMNAGWANQLLNGRVPEGNYVTAGGSEQCYMIFTEVSCDESLSPGEECTRSKLWSVKSEWLIQNSIGGGGQYLPITEINIGETWALPGDKFWTFLGRAPGFFGPGGNEDLVANYGHTSGGGHPTHPIATQDGMMVGNFTTMVNTFDYMLANSPEPILYASDNFHGNSQQVKTDPAFNYPGFMVPGTPNYPIVPIEPNYHVWTGCMYWTPQCPALPNMNAGPWVSLNQIPCGCNLVEPPIPWGTTIPAHLYTDMTACQTNCCPIPESFNCIGLTCIDPGDGSGTYSTEADCLSDCVASFTCSGANGDSVVSTPYTCYDPQDGTGAHNSLISCQGFCADPGGGTGGGGGSGAIITGENSGNTTPLYMTEESLKSYINKLSSPLKAISTSITRDPVSGDPDPFGFYTHCDVPEFCRPVFVLEKHLTVVKKGPTMPPKLQMFAFSDEQNLPDAPGGTWVAGTSTSPDVIIDVSFLGSCMPQSCTHFTNPTLETDGCLYAYTGQGTAFDGGDISCFYNLDYTQKVAGDTMYLPIDVTKSNFGEDWRLGDKLLVQHEYNDSFGVLRKASCRVEIEELVATTPNTGMGALNTFTNLHDKGTQDYTDYTGSIGVCHMEEMVKVKINSISGNFPIDHITSDHVYDVRFIKEEPMFRFKFPKFAYRYQYEDGEYSVFGPWSELAFIPESFDYLPKKGYNLGMENAIRSLKVMNWRPKNMPKDVVKIDILYKESNSPNIYTVESFKQDDPPIAGAITNPWNTSSSGDHFGKYIIKSELIHKVVPSNQLLRPWDNVPRTALGQEITANRLIFANYKQNYDLTTRPWNSNVETPYKPDFLVSINKNDYDNLQLPTGEPAKSLKSMRTYQLGVVYRDRYGRETPVLTSHSGSVEIGKKDAKMQNRLSVRLQGDAPSWAESYTFYIKETSNEYYNLAMDRWYDAEDGNIWLSFPSSERNKIMDDNAESGQGSTRSSFLILKKQHNTDISSDEDIRYKILSVKNEAPLFIKTDTQYWGSVPMMLPPPGWGQGDKAGNWDSGMFAPTGLPLPNRLQLDVYAEYWDQTSLNALSSMNGAQIRIVQTAGQASAYNAITSTVNNKTKWYDIANITYIGTPPQTETISVDNNDGTVTETEVESPNQPEQLVRIQLERAFGDDAGFCVPTGLDVNLSLSRGLSIEARTKTVRDRAQFQGRFFVKILRDGNLDINVIQPTQVIGESWQVLQTKDLKYLSYNHPGMQDWNNTYYMPVGASFDRNGNIKEYDKDGNLTGYAIGEVLEYSSLNVSCSNKGATYRDPSGAIISEYDSQVWPYGPSRDTQGWEDGLTPPGWQKGPYNAPNWWGTKYNDYLYNNAVSSNQDEFPDVAAPVALPYTITTPLTQGNFNHWPSVVPDKWVPYSCNTCTTYATNYPGSNFPGLSAGAGPSLPPLTIPVGEDANYANKSLPGPENWTGIIDFCQETNGPNGSGNFVTSNSFPDKIWLDGANPYQLPAIWGDQSDLMTPTMNSTVSPVKLIQLNSQTITKLREDWYYYWYGNKKVDDSWPRCSFHPERWIIDKVGAAQGYSGNGIWSDGNVGYMQVSYWGIGNVNSWDRSFNMLGSQESEVGFGDALNTVGTKFRFKQDPDQIVYTITNVKANTIYNYEAPQGSWGYEDGNGSQTCDGGSGIGAGLCPPHGSIFKKDNTLAGNTAFISDLFNKDRELTGGAPYNRRIRFTITLDRPIGRDGINQFHPITNHVDADGKANMKIGRAKYSTDLTHVTTAKGGTPAGVEFYNLNSYWNSTNNSTPPVIVGDGDGEVSQPNDINDDFYDRNPNAYIGLHERGLNETTIEIITPYKGEDSDVPMSTNPAIWETEPMEDIGLDIYYAASPTYPVRLHRHRYDENRPDPTDYHINGNQSFAHWYDYSFRGEEFIPVGSKVQVIEPYNSTNPVSTVCNVQDNVIWVTDPINLDLTDPTNPIPITIQSGVKVRFTWPGEGTYYGAGVDEEFVEIDVLKGLEPFKFTVERNVHNVKRSLGYFNCYTYGTGVESNRVRDDYNAVTIDKGVKASMPLAEQYKEEKKESGLIFSGIYNSTSGINRINQFIQAEPITKDLNPVNGSIQKLHTRDTDLVTFCENKVFKILAKKDALYNADGNTNVTANENVLGQAIPFIGEYGISKNPESFAAESYRMYFVDKARGAVLRLSRDGITPISDYGMKDWFKDNLRFADSIIGSFDDREDQYNLTLETADQDGNEKAYTVSYVEKSRGWVSFKSFIQQGGVSHKNIYYTFPSNKYNKLLEEDPWEIPYSGDLDGHAEAWQHHLDLILNRVILTDTSGGSVISISPGTGVILEGMNVTGNGIPIDTVVNSVAGSSVTLSNSVYIEEGKEVTFTTARNSFYGNDNNYSMVKVMFNADQSNTVKRFKTLNYEGTQTKVDEVESNSYQLHDPTTGPVNTGQIYYDNYPKLGWYVHHMETDQQEALLSNFINKEGKWFDYIKGYEIAGNGDDLDTSEFSLQGLGNATLGGPATPTWNCIGTACIDPGDGTGNFNSFADCEAVCPLSYDCISNVCVPNTSCNTCGAYTGINALADCQAVCITPPSIKYKCYQGQCVVCDDGSGGPYVGGLCGSDPTYTTPTCGGDCSQTVVSYNCNPSTHTCEDPGDGSGTYSTITDCILAGGACAQIISGCTDPTASNYDPNATIDDGSCIPIISISGCTDPSAANYDSLANVDDGSCIYETPACDNEPPCSCPPFISYENAIEVLPGGSRYLPYAGCGPDCQGSDPRTQNGMSCGSPFNGSNNTCYYPGYPQIWGGHVGLGASQVEVFIKKNAATSLVAKPVCDPNNPYYSECLNAPDIPLNKRQNINYSLGFGQGAGNSGPQNGISTTFPVTGYAGGPGTGGEQHVDWWTSTGQTGYYSGGSNPGLFPGWYDIHATDASGNTCVVAVVEVQCTTNINGTAYGINCNQLYSQ